MISVKRMDRAPGTEDAGVTGAIRGHLTSGCSSHLMWTWPGVHTAQCAWLCGQLPGCPSHFHVKGRWGRTWGLPSPGGCTVLTAVCPPDRGCRDRPGRGQGEGGSNRRQLSGLVTQRVDSDGQGCCRWPAPSLSIPAQAALGSPSSGGPPSHPWPGCGRQQALTPSRMLSHGARS